MTARDIWILRLHEAVPTAGPAVRRCLASLLAADATSDVLFGVADALIEVAVEVAIDGYTGSADDLRALSAVLAAEAARRAPAHATAFAQPGGRHPGAAP
jgi:hypothetical protein